MYLPGIIFDCDGATCLNDADGDGICDENEVLGCNDPDAYNFVISATEDDGSCWYQFLDVLILWLVIIIHIQK